MPVLLESSDGDEWIWKINLLGGLSVYGAKRKISRFRTRKSAALLAYLAINLGPQPRELLVENFWPEADPDAGRHNLSNALSSLRLVLEPVGVTSGNVIEADRFNVGLNPRSVSTDISDFEQALGRLLLNQGAEPDLINEFEQALGLYRGPLLPGFYEEWVTPESVRLDSIYKQGMIRLTDMLMAEGQFERAVRWAQLGVKNDPLDEGPLLVLMTALEKLSRYPDAIRAYRRFCDRAEQESLASPSRKLQELALQIGARARESSLDLPTLDTSFLEIQRDGVAAAGRKSETSESGLAKARLAGDLQGDSTVHSDAEVSAVLLGNEFLLRTMTRFFGRRGEKTKLANMLTVPRTRLVTITGPGGIGKTRFALETIADIAEGKYGDRDPFAATFVNLADLTDPSKLYGRILEALSGVLQDGEDTRDAVLRLLGSQPNPILILDNFEQLVDDGAAIVLYLLARSSKLRVIVTSRQRLRLDGEHVFALTSLEMPKNEITLDHLSEFPSVGLFIDRAEAASVDFQVNEKNIGVICRLCATLEGAPLALELAAARVSVMSTAHIFAEVERNRLDFLENAHKDATPRQQTIRATLAWSFKLLKEDAQRLLCALSLFRGGWTIEAAQAISGLEISLLGSILTELRDFYLITVLDNDDGLRFSMSEVIREFALDECVRTGQLETFGKAHANYFAVFADETIPGILSPEGVHTLQRFKSEQANLVAARAWADSHPTDPVSQEIGIAIIRFWLSVNWDYHGSTLAENHLARNGQSTLGLLIPLGGPMEPSAEPDEVSGYLQQLADLYEQRGTTEAAGFVLVQLGYTNLGRDLAFARKVAEKGVALLRQVENQTALAHALNALAVIISVAGDYDAARLLNEESYVLLGEDRHSKTYDFAVHAEGAIAFMSGDHSRGEECLKQNLTYARQTSDPRSEFGALYVLGRAYNELGRFSEAFDVLLKASQVFSDSRGVNTYLYGYVSCYLAYSRYKLGEFDEVGDLLKNSMLIFKKHKRIQGFSMAMAFIAEILKDQNRYNLSANIYGASEMFRLRHGRALDYRELEWDKELQAKLSKELASDYEKERAAGFALSEQDAFALAMSALDVCMPPIT